MHVCARVCVCVCVRSTSKRVCAVPCIRKLVTNSAWYVFCAVLGHVADREPIQNFFSELCLTPHKAYDVKQTELRLIDSTPLLHCLIMA